MFANAWHTFACPTIAYINTPDTYFTTVCALSFASFLYLLLPLPLISSTVSPYLACHPRRRRRQGPPRLCSSRCPHTWTHTIIVLRWLTACKSVVLTCTQSKYHRCHHRRRPRTARQTNTRNTHSHSHRHCHTAIKWHAPAAARRHHRRPPHCPARHQHRRQRHHQGPPPPPHHDAPGPGAARRRP